MSIYQIQLNTKKFIEVMRAKAPQKTFGLALIVLLAETFNVYNYTS